MIGDLGECCLAALRVELSVGPPSLAIERSDGPISRTSTPATEAMASRFSSDWEVAAPHRCHFENYLTFRSFNQAARSAKLSLLVIGGSGHGTLRQQGGARERRGARPGCRGGPPAGSAGCEGGDRRRAGQSGQSLAVELGPAASFVRHDVTSEADWARAVEAAEKLGGLHGLVHNAG